MAIRMVDHKSDDFESFPALLGQADTKTPPRVRKKKKSVLQQDFDDVDGEMSMELDDSGLVDTGSANAYFANARHLVPPSSIARAGSSSRPVPRVSEFDFDSIPSPRPRSSTSHARRSSVHNGSSAGPSHLSHSTTAEYDDDVLMADDLGDDDDDDDGDFGGGFQPFDEPPLANGRRESHVSPVTPRRTSFTQIGRESYEDEDENMDLEDLPIAASNRSSVKGKGRAVDDNEDELNLVENDIEEGLDDIENQHFSDEQEPEHEDEPEQGPGPSKKMKKSKNEQPKKPRERKKKEIIPIAPSPENTTGLRRGTRMRYAPLEWWRQEKVVYGRRDGGKSFVPSIKEILRYPKEPPKPLGIAGKKYKRSSAPRSKSKTVDEDAVLVYNPEEGWDSGTKEFGVIRDYITGQEITRRVAYPSHRLLYKTAMSKEFYFQKIFSDSEYAAAGQLMIPAKGHKPSKTTNDNTYIFYVIEGAVTFKVHESSYILCSGGSIMVPRGNTYFIENISDREARLFFAQARRVTVDDEAFPTVQSPPPALRRSSSVGGSTSARRSTSGGPGKKKRRASSPQP
ncbi:hypothetical protein HETIRDRAFT_443810 [Heterobasidion irregulare TC 32-1]|uniref:CENP-C homolog n=1 Tax=Heterobasidion irregulare (strain TC 32-1) TaxID=747525 RepID=W4KMG4_HETIT|nr:uncharacterized protein HETIRDRAFT_443810 [Heterobasidion irregulare TC 32-1]ETW86246.1 hypothetical protein HETIRDRAFT_443810 [Heterobasidion irregulare TC 32-1]